MIEEGGEWVAWDSYRTFKEIAAPTTPETNYLRIYAKDKAGASALYLKDDAGSEREIGPANTVTGTGTANRLAYWSSASVITSNAAFIVDPVTGRVGIGGTTPAFQLHIQPTTPADTRIRLWSGDAAQRASLEVGRTAADTSLSTAGAVSEFSDIVSAAGESVLRAVTSHLIITARNVSGVIKFATGAADAERFRIGSSGQFGIGGATFGTSGQFFTSGGASAAPTWSTHDSTGDPHTQYRLEADNHTHQSSGAQAGTLDHGLALTGLTDDDHTQYTLLAGRSGGQTLIGGTASGNTLNLQGSAHADGGMVDINSDSIAGLRAVNIAPTMAGTADFPTCVNLEPTFNGNANLTTASAYQVLPTFDPPTTRTISFAYGMFARVGTGNGAGAVTSARALNVGAPSLGSLKPGMIYGAIVENQGASGVTTSVGLYLGAQSGSTNNFEIAFDIVDLTAAGAYYARVPVLYNGLLKYVHIFSA